MNGEEYKQLFGMVENQAERIDNLQKALSSREVQEAKFQGEVIARLNSLRCLSHSSEVEAMRVRLQTVEHGMAAAKPWATLLMTLVGGALVALISRFVS